RRGRGTSSCVATAPTRACRWSARTDRGRMTGGGRGNPSAALRSAIPEGRLEPRCRAMIAFADHREGEGMTIRELATSIAAAGLLLAAAAVSAHGHGHEAQGVDPMAPVHVVAERTTFEAALRDFSGQVLPRRDALGRQLVLATMREHQ